VCRSLKEEHDYKLFVDSCGAHFDKREEKHLEIVYILHNLETNDQVRVKVRVDKDVEVPSLTPVYAGANWTERETYDMYGIRFTDHPDMTRILLWEGFNGHPLLKDFPVEGIDTGAAIYPESYTDDAGPVAGTGTGWRPPAPPAEEASESASEPAGEDG
jgi:NADH-quinone oxidoreductase subunit C